MKKGQVVNVLHQIPTDSPFRTYKDIKKHWKNTVNHLYEPVGLLANWQTNSIVNPNDAVYHFNISTV